MAPLTIRSARREPGIPAMKRLCQALNDVDVDCSIEYYDAVQ
jgi:hypothetical protein